MICKLVPHFAKWQEMGELDFITPFRSIFFSLIPLLLRFPPLLFSHLACSLFVHFRFVNTPFLKKGRFFGLPSRAKQYVSQPLQVWLFHRDFTFRSRLSALHIAKDGCFRQYTLLAQYSSTVLQYSKLGLTTHKTKQIILHRAQKKTTIGESKSLLLNGKCQKNEKKETMQ